MVRIKNVFVCQKCGSEQPKWQGQCPQCGEWNSLVETLRSVGQAEGKRWGESGEKMAGKVIKLPDVDAAGSFLKRFEVGSRELSQVLGGGLVPGSVVLVGGEPGIGKSTLLSQLALYFAAKHGKVLYVCGEESVEQVKLRLDRLVEYKKTKKGHQERLLLLPEIDVDLVGGTMEQEKPQLVVIDSIQAMNTSELTGMAGSVGQVRESAQRLATIAKKLKIPTFLVGHVTKEGSIAGPKVLEHMVDLVLEMTGERSGSFRLLRAAKNRFGTTDEVGVFEMSESGLRDVANASMAFLEESQRGVPGSAVVVLMEGTRSILTEIQALVVPSQLAVPRRVAQGVGINRVQLLAAVLTKSCKLGLGGSDIFVNVAGGLTALEPAADLGIAVAIASSFLNRALPKKSVVIGEVGLLGEIRRVSWLAKRVKEAKKLGFSQVITSEKNSQVAAVVSQYLR